MELNVYPELMKGITAYRWIILEPSSNPSNEETFDFEDWIKRYDDSLNEVRDCLDINCAFISKELNQKIEGLQELGSDMSLHAVFN